ncbi:MAG: alpha-2-macroglobulin family protein, partial [Thermoguttaceae bacterium]
MGFGTRVGQGQTDVITRKDLIVRLEAPRFFVQNDEVVLSAVVHNYLKTAKKVEVSFELRGKTLELIPEGTKMSAKPGHQVLLNTGKMHNPPVDVPAGGEARVDWRMKVLNEGEVTIRMNALTDEESDAMEQKFPCYIHGALKMEARSGVIRSQQTEG